MADSLKQAEDILTSQELQELISLGQLSPSSRSSDDRGTDPIGGVEMVE